MRGRDLLLRGGARIDSFAAFDALVQSLYVNNATTGIWYSGENTDFRRVNSDGTGGHPADDVTYSHLVDRTGGGRHATAIAGAGFIARNGRSSVPSRDFPYGGTQTVRRMIASSASAATTQACTGFVIMDTQTTPLNCIPFSAPTISRGNTLWPCRWTFLLWRAGPAGVEYWCNDVQYTGAALALAATTAPQIVCDAATCAPGMFYQYAHLDMRLNDADFARLRAALMAVSRADLLTPNVMLVCGDSQDQGVYDDLGWTWPAYLNTTDRVYNTGVQGVSIGGLSPSSQMQRYKGPARNTVLLKMGFNDGGGVNPSKFMKGILYHGQHEGWRTLLCTYPNIGASLTTMNADIRANAPSNYAAVVDLIAVPELSNSGNTTYFQPDGIHFKSSVYPFVAATVDSVKAVSDVTPRVRFTAAPQNGLTSINAAFTENSLDGPALSYLWDKLGDGSVTSTAASPSFTYGVGVAAPKLTIVTAAGSATRARPFFINVMTGSLSIVSRTLVAAHEFNAGLTQSGGFLDAWDDATANATHLLASLTTRPAVDGSGIVTWDGVNDYMSAAVPWSFRVGCHMRLRLNAYANDKRLWSGNNSNARFGGVGVTGALNQIVAWADASTAWMNNLPTGVWMTIYIGPVGEVTDERIQVKVSGYDPVYGFAQSSAAPVTISVGGSVGSRCASMSLKAAYFYDGTGLTPQELGQNEAKLDPL